MCFLTIVIWIVPQIFQNNLAHEFSSVVWWGPESLVIGVSLIVYVISRREHVTIDSVLTLALLYQVVVSFAIAFAQYWGRFDDNALVDVVLLDDLLGFSYVAEWMLFFTVFVPNRPRSALVALLASATAVPIVYLLASNFGDAPKFPPFRFFVAFVFPYLCCAIATFMGARVMHQMGTAIKEAREMGSYQLVSLLGRGGMGEVWRAKHRMLARPAAVKPIRSDALEAVPTRKFDAAYRRFEEEAQATASLRSPHVVELYDYGRADDGTFYYVMELPEGIDMQKLVASNGALPPARVIHFLIQICHALGEAHENDLIHRDIKPANLCVCRFGREYNFVKVLDFGLVQISGLETDNASPADQPALVGSPGYVAPEILSRGAGADQRSNIYSLGCVAYWLLTGDNVFECGTVGESLERHINSKPIAPSQQTDSPIPESLDGVVLACFDKDPKKRPQNADQLSDSIMKCDVGSEWTQQQSQN